MARPVICIAVAALTLPGFAAGDLSSDADADVTAGGELVETAAAANPGPCEAEAFREFDFWIGSWEVSRPDGTVAGHNLIEASQRGCVLIERWTGARGGTGLSVNYRDRSSGEWVQLWLDATGARIDIRGGLTDEGMLLEGEIHAADGDVLPFRGLWTPQPDGRVRQYFEQSSDGGQSWAPWFEGFYRRVGLDDDVPQ